MYGGKSTHALNSQEIVIAYERQLVNGDIKTAKNIRSVHTDLTKEFDAVDARLSAVHT